MRILFSIFCITLILGCNAKNKTTLTVNFKCDRDVPVNIYPLGEKITLEKQEDGKLVQEFKKCPDDLFLINIDNWGMMIYIEEGKDLTLDIEAVYNERNRMNQLKIDTPDEFYNKVLTYMLRFGRSSNAIDSEDFKKEEKHFKRMVEDLIKNDIEHLEKLDLPENFKKLQKANIKASLLSILADHEIGYTYLNQIDPKTYSMSDECVNFLKSSIINDKSMAASPTSLYHLINMYLTKVEKVYSKDLEEKMFNRIDYMEKMVEDPVLLEKLIFYEMANLMQNQKFKLTDKVPEAIESFKNKTFRKKLSNIYQISKNVSNNDEAYNFKAVDINGKETKLSDFQGKLTVIEVWASWCEPCIAGMPKYQEAQENFELKPVNFVTVSIDEKPEAWKKRVEKLELKGNVLRVLDKKKFMEAYGLFGVPATIIIDKDGNVLDGNAPRVDSNDFEPTINSYLK